MLEIDVFENGENQKVIFSGDIGQWDKPIIRDPTMFDQADYVVMESTYGDRNHKDYGDCEDQLADVVNEPSNAAVTSLFRPSPWNAVRN